MSADLAACMSSALKPASWKLVTHIGGAGRLFSSKILPLRSGTCRSESRHGCLFYSAAAAYPSAFPGGRMTEGSRPAVILDKEKFRRKLDLKALRVPKEHAHFVSKTVSRFTLDRQRLKHVIRDPSSDRYRLVLLSENVDETSLPDETLAAIKEVTDLEFVPHEVDLDYSSFTVEQVLTEILPKGWKVPASFETVGHIAHLNLTDELLPYKRIIAEVFLDKNAPRIRTVVNKVGTISNQFRVPTWEVLAGDTDLVAEVKQQGAVFRLDFGLVYWNSRLEFEHKRLPSLFKPGQVVVDMFAGIGPFAIPAAQKGCVVLANDLNPDSVKYLKVNAKLNKVEGRVFSYNMDAREFMRHIVKPAEPESGPNAEKVEDGIQKGSSTEAVPEQDISGEDRKPVAEASKVKRKSKGKQAEQVPPPKPWESFHHVPMNLPASAIEFLDVFQGLLSRDHWKGPMPRIHCYCFMKAAETHTDVLKRAEGILGGLIENPEVWTVRDVAPNKIMLCISFDLPETVAFREARKEVPAVVSSSAEARTDSSLDQVSSCVAAQLQPKRARTEC